MNWAVTLGRKIRCDLEVTARDGRNFWPVRDTWYGLQTAGEKAIGLIVFFNDNGLKHADLGGRFFG